MSTKDIKIDGDKKQPIFHQHSDFEYKKEFTEEEMDMFDYENISGDFEIPYYFDSWKLQEIKKEYLKKMKKLKQTETMKCENKIISKVEKK